MKIDELPRKAFLGYLELTRLPLTAAERALKRTEGTWGPTMAADRLQAKLKNAAGSLLNDETLLADARMQTAALDERMRAAEARAEAERIRREADAKLAQDQRAVQEAKRDVLKRDEQREQVIDARIEAEERKVVQKTVAKKNTARKVASAQEDALEQRETAAKREILGKESKALNDQRAATEAKAEVLDLEDKLNEVKAARKSG
jgi:hypothetical protein